MAVKNLRIDQIDVPSRFRSLSGPKVETLKRSIKDIGLLNPITVYPFPGQDDKYKLSAGAHRLQAIKDLGWETVTVHFIEGDEDHRRLAEIDENLVRSELSPAELAYTEAKRKEIWRKIRKAAGKSTHMLRPADVIPAKQDLRPDENSVVNLFSKTAHDNQAPAPAVIGDLDDPDIGGGSNSRKGFALETSELTGESKRAINRNIRRGRILGKEALDKIKGTSLDSGVQLDALVDMPEAERNAAIEKAAAGYIVNVIERPAGFATGTVRKAVRALDQCARILDSDSFTKVLTEIDLDTHERLPILARKLAEVLEHKKPPSD